MEKREIHCQANIFPSNQFRVKFFSKKIDLTKFLRQKPNFHNVIHLYFDRKTVGRVFDQITKPTWRSRIGERNSRIHFAPGCH